MTWQENLLSNLLTVFILICLALIVYSRVTNKSLPEIFREIKEIMSPQEVVENYE